MTFFRIFISAIILLFSQTFSFSHSLFSISPYLQNPTDNGMTVSWVTTTPCYSWVEYGTDKNELAVARNIVDGQVICNNKLHKIRLKNLLSDQRYYYRICSKEILEYAPYSKQFGKEEKSEFYSFRTFEKGDIDFTACVFNDLHKQHLTLQQLYSVVSPYKPDCFFFNGDCIDDPQDEEMVVKFLKELCGTVKAESVPVIFIRGNHEIRGAYSISLRSFFDYVGDKTYGAFNIGKTRFVILDCGEDKPDDTPVYYGLNDFTEFRKAQIPFLRQELASKNFKRSHFKILLHHIPLYGTSDIYNPCHSLWHDILKKSAFDVAINGHEHQSAFYSKGEIGNTFPVFIGGGFRLEDATAILIIKRGKRMTVKMLNAKGEMISELNLNS